MVVSVLEFVTTIICIMIFKGGPVAPLKWFWKALIELTNLTGSLWASYIQLSVNARDWQQLMGQNFKSELGIRAGLLTSSLNWTTKRDFYINFPYFLSWNHGRECK